MSRRRIAILGGGIGGLTTAYHLSRTPELRDRFEVTVHQMGWKLGGKISSGRDAQGRNLEHGLHIWFGCYENTFQMLQEVYAGRQAPPGSPFQTWRDVAKPQDFTPIGVRMGDGWGFAAIEWPRNAGTPGDGRLFPTLWEMVTELVNLVRIVVHRLEGDGLSGTPPAHDPGLMKRLLGHVATSASAAADEMVATFGRVLGARGPVAKELAAMLHAAAAALGADPFRLGADALRDMAEAMHLLRGGHGARSALAATPTERLMLEAIEVGLTVARGIVEDLILHDRPFESLDDIEFRAWLLKHGADPRVVAESSVVRAPYDTAFLYVDGDPAKPSVGAGCAIGGVLRLVATYKGAMAWDLQGGMGEAFIAPVYQRLLEQGVRFEFFSKMTAIRPEPGRDAIASVEIERQATMLPGYRLLRRFDDIDCWLAEPDWDNLADGPRLKAAGVNFESHWCAEPPVGRRTLHRGEDFDDVVLAMPVGTWKKLNDEAGPCDDLLARGGRFAAFTEALGIVPTVALQFWTLADAKALGWTGPRPAVVAGPEPICVWADMSQVLRTETPMTPPAKGLHYLCGTYATRLYARPSTDRGTPGRAKAEAQAMALQFLGGDAKAYWPLAVDAQGFRWPLLADSEGRVGAARMATQYVRANIDPTECCVGSDAGTTKYRLGPGDSGFEGLWLAGESTRSGFNATCVEATVMTGMAAARALAGLNLSIVGYDFPRMRPSEFLRRNA